METDTPSVASAEAAGTYLQRFVRSRQSELRDLYRETRPGAGYGRYKGHEHVSNAGAYLYDIADEKFLNIRIPDDYASPESLEATIKDFQAALSHSEGSLRKVVDSFNNDDAGPPANAVMLLQEIAEYRLAAEHALKLLNPPRPKVAILPRTSTSPSPPNWANVTSVVIAAAVAFAAVVAWGVRLEFAESALEKRVEKLEQSISSISTEKSGSNAEISTTIAATCRDMAGKYSEYRNIYRYADAESISGLMKQLGCMSSANVSVIRSK